MNLLSLPLESLPPLCRARYDLTPRECEVLHWLVEGKRDAEIAVILDLSVRTVEQHVRTCLRKLDVETRTAACATVWRARTGTT